MPGHLNYAAATSAVATMTVTLARELAPCGLRVNVVAPVAMTRMTEEMVQTERFSPVQRSDFKPESVAAATTWLASPLAEGISGQLIGVMGSTALLWTGRSRFNAIVASAGVWTPAELDRQRQVLFAGRSIGVPAAEESL